MKSRKNSRRMAIVALGLAGLIIGIGSSEAKYEKPYTWENFQGEWVGYDDSGRYFLLVAFDRSQRGNCVVTFCRDLIQTYTVSDVRWGSTGGIRLTLAPTRKNGQDGAVEIVGGYSSDYGGFRLSSTGSVLSASFRLVRLGDLVRDIETAKAQVAVSEKPTQQGGRGSICQTNSVKSPYGAKTSGLGRGHPSKSDSIEKPPVFRRT